MLRNPPKFTPDHTKVTSKTSFACRKKSTSGCRPPRPIHENDRDFKILVTSMSPDNVTYEYLRLFFHMPIASVSNQLGMCTTRLKKICRSYGIQRWPHRQLRKIDNCIASLRAAVKNARNDHDLARLSGQINDLKNMAMAVREDPNSVHVLATSQNTFDANLKLQPKHMSAILNKFNASHTKKDQNDSSSFKSHTRLGSKVTDVTKKIPDRSSDIEANIKLKCRGLKVKKSVRGSTKPIVKTEVSSKNVIPQAQAIYRPESGAVADCTQLQLASLIGLEVEKEQKEAQAQAILAQVQPEVQELQRDMEVQAKIIANLDLIQQQQQPTNLHSSHLHWSRASDGMLRHNCPNPPMQRTMLRQEKRTESQATYTWFLQNDSILSSLRRLQHTIKESSI
jgi:hypothetical protein